MSELAKAWKDLELEQLPSLDGESDPDYVIFRYPDLQMEDALCLHVLARAYRNAWRVMHGCDPRGEHPIKSLEVLIVFRG